ncbi:MAG: hypothetical protein K2J13_03555, partial [Clostridia bacterium]|nr:hypothetical protein [Clostridia bacterium]
MLPNVTQYLPQEASYNDELVQQLIEQNAQNEERMRQMNEENEERVRQLTEQNEAIMRNLAQGQEMLMQRFAEEKKERVDEEVIEKLAEKLAKQQAIEQVAGKEVAATVVNDDALKELRDSINEIKSQMNAAEEKAEKEKNAEIIRKIVEGQENLMRKMSEQQPIDRYGRAVAYDPNADKIEMLMRNQEMLMKQMMEMSANRNNDKQVVMPYMPPQPTERVVEKIVEKPVPVPVEKVVEKEVVKEVPVPMPVEKPTKEAKAPAQRLTLDEAYAKLSANQKKIFDTLKAYAMSKDKCKEKKSTYFTVLGQSTVNPLVKLTIKKNTTVAMFKMEDEYFKDIRRNATSDGSKIKVKESELVVSDNQALATAKDMIDLREDQIERYNDYLKEQRSMKKK